MMVDVVIGMVGALLIFMLGFGLGTGTQKEANKERNHERAVLGEEIKKIRYGIEQLNEKRR